jgi:alpha-tubulin suppressor-like RCC1 family protein
VKTSIVPRVSYRLAPAARCLVSIAPLALLAGCDSITGSGGGAPRLDPQRALAVGERHACVLTEQGEAFCWGGGESGQLGHGILTISEVPVRVAGDHRFVAIHAGGVQTCALTNDGDAYCWGSNRSGQLGTGLSTSESRPTPVAGGLKFESISVGGFAHACGRTTDGLIYCWGSDQFGQLGFTPTETCTVGTGEIACSRTPQQVALGGAASGVSAGFVHTCALRTDAPALCWGDNTAGQMGTGIIEERGPPTAMAGSVRFASLASGSLHGCGLAADGRAYCWGDGRMGALGVPGTTESLTPAAVSGGHTFRRISASHGNTSLAHTCAVDRDGRAHCWGTNANGQLGIGDEAAESCVARFGPTFPCSTAPRAVSGGESWAAIAAANSFTCGISTAGEAFCWGLGEVGQLGTGRTASAATPQPVTGGLRLPRAAR